MITMEDLEALTRSDVSPTRGIRVTVKLEPDIVVEAVIAYLTEYFEKRQRQKTVRLLFSGGTSGHLLRDDFYSLVSSASRGIGGSDGATLEGTPGSVEFTRLCCPVKGCPDILLTTSYDPDDPRMCGKHPKSKMGPCK